MNTDSMQPDERRRGKTSPRRRVVRRSVATAAAFACLVATLMVTSAAAAPKQIAFSGTIEGVSIDVGTLVTGNTFQTAGGTFAGIEGLKSGVYSASFRLGSGAALPGLGIRYMVTGSFALETNGGTLTAVVIPATSFVSCCATPTSFFSAFFNLRLQVVGGTGRFKKMSGTIAINGFASMCGALGQEPRPPCPAVPPGSDPIPDWRMTGDVTGTLTRTGG